MKNKIKFLQLIFKRTSCQYEMLDFLRTHRLITEDELIAIRNQEPATLPETVYELLEQRLTKERLQLVHYEWVLLPSERMKLNIVADTASIDFTFGV